MVPARSAGRWLRVAESKADRKKLTEREWVEKLPPLLPDANWFMPRYAEDFCPACDLGVNACTCELEPVDNPRPPMTYEDGDFGTSSDEQVL